MYSAGEGELASLWPTSPREKERKSEGGKGQEGKAGGGGYAVATDTTSKECY